MRETGKVQVPKSIYLNDKWEDMGPSNTVSFEFYKQEKIPNLKIHTYKERIEPT